MRTTLTLDDDVAALLERVRKESKSSYKEVVNKALREGLHVMSKPKERVPFRTKTLITGPPTIENLDNIEEVLSLIEGDNRR